MELRRFNSSGLGLFGAFLDGLHSEVQEPVPTWLLTADKHTEVVAAGVEVRVRQFDTRMDVGKEMLDLLGRTAHPNPEQDSGLWAWLALFYFEALCVKTRGDRWKPGARVRWIPDVANYRRYYRHLLAGPFHIYRSHSEDPDEALALLCGSAQAQGELVEQLASRQELVTNRAIIGAASQLYCNRPAGTAKRGSGGKGPGSARRFAEVLAQFDLTWDLYAMTPKEVVELLPDEFDRFKPRR